MGDEDGDKNGDPTSMHCLKMKCLHEYKLSGQGLAHRRCLGKVSLYQHRVP